MGESIDFLAAEPLIRVSPLEYWVILMSHFSVFCTGCGAGGAARDALSVLGIEDECQDGASHVPDKCGLRRESVALAPSLTRLMDALAHRQPK